MTPEPGSATEPEPEPIPAPGSSVPTLRVISGDATPEEIAAILALLGARTSALAAEQLTQENAGVWSSPAGRHRRVRAVQQASRHGWRTSYWPR